MPIHEAIVDSIIPHKVEQPIPTRTATTRSPRATSTPAESVRDQADTLREKAVGADSSATADSVRLSPQLTALARKEQAYHQRKQALDAREKEIEAKLADADKFAQLKSKVAAKDFSEAEALGLSYEDYTSYLLSKQNGEKPENQALKKLEEQVLALSKSQEESQTAQYDATVSEYRKEISTFVEGNPEFAGLKTPENQKAVLQLILDTFEQDDEEMTIEQAAKDVKAFLVDQAKKLEIFLEKKEAPVEEKRTLPPPAKSKLSTLTNQVNAGANAAPLKSLQHLPDNERYAEAYRRAQAKQKAQQGIS